MWREANATPREKFTNLKRALSVKERPTATLPLRPGLAPNAPIRTRGWHRRAPRIRERPNVASTAICTSRHPTSFGTKLTSVRLHPGVAERRQQLQQRHQGGTPVRTSGGNRGCSTPCAMPSSARNRLGIHEARGPWAHNSNAGRYPRCPGRSAFGFSHELPPWGSTLGSTRTLLR